MLENDFPADAFGDRFDVTALPLPRTPAGYAVQRLDTDQLLDRDTGELRPVRTPQFDGLFDTFDEAYAAARKWVETHCSTPAEHHLAIVPAGYDTTLERHVLIYGVLCSSP